MFNYRDPSSIRSSSVGMSDTQCNTLPDRSNMLPTNHVNSVLNKLPKHFKSYLVFYWYLMCKVNDVQSKQVAKSNWEKVIPEMILLEDHSQALPSPSVSFALTEVKKIMDAHVSYGEGLRQALRRRRVLSVSTYSTLRRTINQH